MEMQKEPGEKDEGVGTEKGLWDVEGIQGQMPVGGARHLLGFLEVPLWQSQTVHFNFSK